MKRSEKKSEEKRLRVLRPGESFLVSHTMHELEVILYRPIQRNDSVQPQRGAAEEQEATEGAAESPVSTSEAGSSETEDRPLFFDTTACFFLDGAGRVDYVTPGHTGISTQGAVYLPHAIITGHEAGLHHAGLLSAPVVATEDATDGAWALTNPLAPHSYTTKQNGATMVPGDGVLLNFSGLTSCVGALVCGTLFTPGVALSHVTNTFFVVRRPKTTTPLCFIPVSVNNDACNSCVGLMLRHVRVRGEVSWEIVNVGEGLPHTDVKGVLRALQVRGLRDPGGYSGGALLAAESGSDTSDCDHVTTAESSNTQNEVPLEEMLSPPGQESETPRAVPKGTDPAVTHAPRLVRRGKHQYNVGRSAARGDSSSEEDEAMDDVLRAVVPHYAASEVVRYESGAYNVGSKPTTLAAHYIGHREQYAVDAADTTKRDSMTSRKSAPDSKSNSLGLPSHSFPVAAMADIRRDSDSVQQDPSSWRPAMPLELLSPAARAGVMGAQQTRDGTSPRKRPSQSRSRSHSNNNNGTQAKRKKKTKAKGEPSSGVPPADGAKAKRAPSTRRGVSSKRTTAKEKQPPSGRK